MKYYNIFRLTFHLESPRGPQIIPIHSSRVWSPCLLVSSSIPSFAGSLGSTLPDHHEDDGDGDDDGTNNRDVRGNKKWILDLWAWKLILIWFSSVWVDRREWKMRNQEKRGKDQEVTKYVILVISYESRNISKSSSTTNLSHGTKRNRDFLIISLLFLSVPHFFPFGNNTLTKYDDVWTWGVLSWRTKTISRFFYSFYTSWNSFVILFNPTVWNGLKIEEKDVAWRFSSRSSTTFLFTDFPVAFQEENKETHPLLILISLSNTVDHLELMKFSVCKTIIHWER